MAAIEVRTDALWSANVFYEALVHVWKMKSQYFEQIST